MRRLTTGFTVVVLVLLFASVAGAVPPGFCNDKPDHPQCTTTTEPSSTTSTTSEAPSELDPCPDAMTVVGSGQTMFECLWEPINDGSLTATVTISDITGAIKGPPTLFIRDDSPGDICVLLQDGEWDPPTEYGYEASFDLFYDEVPVPTLEDPDVLDYGAWLGHNYWDFVLADGMEQGTHWCAPQDPILDSLRYDNNGGALHFQISFNARGGGSLDFILEPGNSL